MPGWSGFDFTEFNQLIAQVERLGADTKKVAEHVLNAGSEPARQAFAKHVPYDTTTPADKRKHEHARDHVKVSKTKTSKRYKNKFRIIGATSEGTGDMAEVKRVRKDSDKTGGDFEYLTYVEYGHSKAPAKPFLVDAYHAARDAASEPMRQALINEIENHLR